MGTVKPQLPWYLGLFVGFKVMKDVRFTITCSVVSVSPSCCLKSFKDPALEEIRSLHSQTDVAVAYTA